jgi:hypothetical protein
VDIWLSSAASLSWSFISLNFVEAKIFPKEIAA